MLRPKMLVVIVFMVFGSQFAYAATAQDDAEAVRVRLSQFLDRLITLSKASPPPGVNASNGWFVSAVKGTDVPLTRLIENTVPVSTTEGEYLASQFSQFARGVRGAFGPGLHGSSALTNIAVLRDTFNAVLPQIKKKAKEVAKGHPVRLDDIDAIAQSLQGKVVTAGEHADGWISVYLRDFCKKYNASLVTADKMTTSAGRSTVAAMRAVCIGWAALPTEGHSPWLRADWQLGFQAISEAGKAILK